MVEGFFAWSFASRFFSPVNLEVSSLDEVGRYGMGSPQDFVGA